MDLSHLELPKWILCIFPFLIAFLAGFLMFRNEKLVNNKSAGFWIGGMMLTFSLVMLATMGTKLLRLFWFLQNMRRAKQRVEVGNEFWIIPLSLVIIMILSIILLVKTANNDMNKEDDYIFGGITIFLTLVLLFFGCDDLWDFFRK